MTDEEAGRLMREYKDCIRAINRSANVWSTTRAQQRKAEITDQLHDAGWYLVWTKVAMVTNG